MANKHQTLSKKERNRIDRMVKAKHRSSEAIDRAAKELNRKRKPKKKGSPEPKFEHRRKITTQVEEVVTSKKGKKYTKTRDKVTYGDKLPDTPLRTDLGYAGETPCTHGFSPKQERAKMRRYENSFLMVAPNDEAWFTPMGEPDKVPASFDVEYLGKVHNDAAHAPGREMRYLVGSELYACFTVTENGVVCTHDRQKRRLVAVKKGTPAIDAQGNRYRRCMTPVESYTEVADKADYDKQVKAEAKRQRNA